MPGVRPFGTWPSPIDPALAAASSVIVSDLQVSGREIWWLEMRPDLDGRTVPVRWRAGDVRDVIPGDLNVRTRVHEYGGGAMRVGRGTIVMSNDPDGTVWRMTTGGDELVQLTQPEDGRFADFAFDHARKRVLAVREPADGTPAHEVRTTVVAIDLDGGGVTELVRGPDFVAAPRPSPNGEAVAWIEWDHPRMPWDGTTLRLAIVQEDGTLEEGRTIAGGPEESVIEPRWTPGNDLMYMSDADGFWSLYRFAPTAPEEREVTFRAQRDLAGPTWKLGQRTWAVAPPKGVLAAVRNGGRSRLVAAPGRRGRGTQARTLHDDAARILAIDGGEGGAAMLVTHPSRPTEIVRIDPLTDDVEVVRSLPVPRLDGAVLPEPREITFEGGDGETSHAWYYPPANAEWTGPEGERPPLLVRVHGGPTGAARLEYDLELRFWTSRGWAVCDVDHGGSAGYGRAYRERLRGQWGVLDVADCAAAVRTLADAGTVDADRVAITGGSAGGYTTLMALATTDVFGAGANRFGIADLVAFRDETHRFESRYLDGLIGPWPEAEAIYRERSPIQHLDDFTSPLAVFQGAEDRVVPPSQSELIVKALEARGVPVRYELFAGEQHGFRRQSSIQRTLVVMDRFLRETFSIGISDVEDGLDEDE